MSSVLKYIKEFYTKEFNAAYLFIILVMLGVLIYLNYWHQLERRYAAGGNTWFSNFIGYYFLYLIPFAAAFLLQLLFYKNCSYFGNYWFWIILLLAPAFFSFRINFSFQEKYVY
ncbi:MAG: hypothetical protein HC867_07800 [Bacteroidia bacterium]|nr:hypothetical protein [Bacteroidia bacterium]